MYDDDMRYIGIDFGTKKVGVSVSNEKGTIAFPKIILPNNSQLIPEIKVLIEEYGVECVVIGDSRDIDDTENPLMREAKEFGEDLAALNITVAWEREDFTSEVAREVQKNINKTDASAAALILQSYLDTQNNSL